MIVCRHPRSQRLKALGDLPESCGVCGHQFDPARQKAGRNTRSRRLAIQRERIRGLGGTNLAGSTPGLDGLGAMFRYESKTAKPGEPPKGKPRITTFPEHAWAILRGIPAPVGQTRVLILTEAPGPGRRARSLVMVEYDDWKALHFEDVDVA